MVINCFCCGKPITNEYYWQINYDNANGKVIAPSETPEHGQFGFLPVGGGCRSRMIKEGTPKDWFVPFKPDGEKLTFDDVRSMSRSLKDLPPASWD